MSYHQSISIINIVIPIISLKWSKPILLQPSLKFHAPLYLLFHTFHLYPSLCLSIASCIYKTFVVSVPLCNHKSQQREQFGPPTLIVRNCHPASPQISPSRLSHRPFPTNAHQTKIVVAAPSRQHPPIPDQLTQSIYNLKT